MATPPTQTGYSRKHTFKREMGTDDGTGVVFKVLGDEGKLDIYSEIAKEKPGKTGQQDTKEFTRVISAKDTRGVAWGLMDPKKNGKFKYHEVIEFKSSSSV
jgi:hypothetical protein